MSELLKKENIQNFNRTLTEPRTDVRRELQEINQRRNSNRQIFDIGERDMDIKDEKNLTQRISNLRNEENREIEEGERRVGKTNLKDPNYMLNEESQIGNLSGMQKEDIHFRSKKIIKREENAEKKIDNAGSNKEPISKKFRKVKKVKKLLHKKSK